MNTRLLAALEEAIDKWVDSECDKDDWIRAYWPQNGVELMAKAAAAVVDALEAEKVFIDNNHG